MLDEGADFVTESHDVALRLFDELEIPLVRSLMTMGWHKGGRYFVTSPERTPGGAISNLPALWALGLLSPRALWAAVKISRMIKGKPLHFSFASDSKVAEVDENESTSDFMSRIGAPQNMRQAVQGLLEMTMGDLDEMGSAFALTFVAQIMMRTDALFVPEKGIGSLAYAMADASEAEIRTSTPVRRVVFRNGSAMGVVVDDYLIEADAVICTTTAGTTCSIIPDMPVSLRNVLRRVNYARACRTVIGLDHRPLPQGWNCVLYPDDETPLLLDRSINLPACVPSGKSTLDLLAGRDRAEELFGLDDDEVKRAMLADVRRHPLPPGCNLPGDDDGLFFRVYRWPEALCIGPPGILKEISEVRSRNEVAKNLFLAGDYMRMPSVNGALASGVDAAERAAELLRNRTE